MRRFVIEISESAFSSLVELAIAQRRPVKEQGAVLLERAIHDALPRAGQLEFEIKRLTTELAALKAAGQDHAPDLP